MSDVTAFLRARLDDDEKIALTSKAVNHRSDSGIWTFSDGEAEAEWESHRRFGGAYKVVVHSGVWGGNFHLSSSGNPRTQNPDMIHIAHHDPARVLREVAAKRSIILAHVLVPARDIWGDETGGVGCEKCDDVPRFMLGGSEIHASGGCQTLRALAAVYSDHPDYQKEWEL